jgi:glucose/arabinose dehydrogenase
MAGPTAIGVSISIRASIRKSPTSSKARSHLIMGSARTSPRSGSALRAVRLSGFAQGAFVGEHGSWNRQHLAGYKVSFVPFAGGKPAGKPKDFVTGFIKDGRARGRPVGVTYDAARGALWIADDLSNTTVGFMAGHGSAQYAI